MWNHTNHHTRLTPPLNGPTRALTQAGQAASNGDLWMVQKPPQGSDQLLCNQHWSHQRLQQLDRTNFYMYILSIMWELLVSCVLCKIARYLWHHSRILQSMSKDKMQLARALFGITFFRVFSNNNVLTSPLWMPLGLIPQFLLHLASHPHTPILISDVCCVVKIV